MSEDHPAQLMTELSLSSFTCVKLFRRDVSYSENKTAMTHDRCLPSDDVCHLQAARLTPSGDAAAVQARQAGSLTGGGDLEEATTRSAAQPRPGISQKHHCHCYYMHKHEHSLPRRFHSIMKQLLLHNPNIAEPILSPISVLHNKPRTDTCRSPISLSGT